jgi:hypothetical protein
MLIKQSGITPTDAKIIATYKDPLEFAKELSAIIYKICVQCQRVRDKAVIFPQVRIRPEFNGPRIAAFSLGYYVCGINLRSV